MNQTRNLFLALLPDQWRGDAAPGQMDVQIIRRSITPGSEPGWVRCEAWRYVGGPAPELVSIEVRAEVLPPDARPVPLAGQPGPASGDGSADYAWSATALA